MRILVVCDDPAHPASIIRDGLAPLKDAGFTFDWIENAADWSAERMFEYPLVILTKANCLPTPGESPFGQ